MRSRLPGRVSRILELAILLAVNQLSIGIEHCETRNAALHWNLAFRHQILVLLSPANVNVHDFIVRGKNRRHLRTMKSLIQRMAVEAPVGSKHNNDAFVFACRLFQSFFNFNVRVRRRRINVFLVLNRLANTDRAGRKRPSLP